MWKGCAVLLWSLLPVTYLLVTLAGTESRPIHATHDEIGFRPPFTTDAEAAPQPLTQEQPAGDGICLTCHADSSLETSFTDGQPLSLYVDATALRDSAHFLLNCVTCHDRYEIRPPEAREQLDFVAHQNEAEAICARCHETAARGYEGSAHWKSGFIDGEVATCTDCHSADGSGHSVAATRDPQSMLAPARLADECGRCHQQAQHTFEETSHGKVARFGNVAATATCTTCHNHHAVETVDELLQPASTASLVATCEKCHDGADEAFFRAWPGHSNGAPDGSTAGIVGRAGFFMAAAVVGAGVTHAALDSFRRLSGRNRRAT
jgi:hypothetical protein